MAILRAATLGTMLALGSGPAARAEDASVTIDNFSFTPAEITITLGTTVTWTNRDDIPHTVSDAADPRIGRSPPLDTGETFHRRFDRVGTFRYFCSLHPHMQGIVVVR